MPELEKYSRYVNKDDELFILLNKWSTVKIVDNEPKITPTTCDLLDVAKQKLVTKNGEALKVIELQELVKSGRLRKIK